MQKLTKKARLPVWRRLAWRLGASFLLVTAITILLSGFLQYRAQEQDLRETLGSLLLSIARTGALLVDPQLHAEVEATLSQDTEAYRQIRAALAMIQDDNQIETPIYTLTGFDADKRQAHFMVTSRGPGAPGEPYPLVPELVEPLGRAFREGVHVEAWPPTPTFTGISRAPGSQLSRRFGMRKAGSSQCWMWTTVSKFTLTGLPRSGGGFT